MLGLGCCALLSGCGDPIGPKILQLAQNRARWESQNVHSYTIHQTNSCFCGYSGQTVAVQVQADAVASVRLVATGEEIDKRGWQTVPELFDFAERLLGTPNYKVTVRYEPSMGFPTNIDYACPKNLLDCGSSSVIRLVPQPNMAATHAVQRSPTLSLRN